VDDPLPEDCHAEAHADYEGAGISWGLDHKTRSAAACCAACKARVGPPDRCSVWVWCGESLQEVHMYDRRLRLCGFDFSGYFFHLFYKVNFIIKLS